MRWCWVVVFLTDNSNTLEVAFAIGCGNKQVVIVCQTPIGYRVKYGEEDFKRHNMQDPSTINIKVLSVSHTQHHSQPPALED